MKDAQPTEQAAATRVEISAGAHQVIIEAAEPLVDVAGLALTLWKQTENAAISRGFGTSVGFHTELAVDEPYAEDDPGGITSRRRG